MGLTSGLPSDPQKEEDINSNVHKASGAPESGKGKSVKNDDCWSLVEIEMILRDKGLVSRAIERGCFKLR